ncbi:MAG: 4Fe-4S cluster-binding domain-containing protein [Bacillota bacterium]|nr:4Fe-4S cluster-binding domain-containing protein [Bacillota bacterium]
MFESGELQKRTEEAGGRLERCFVCPRACGTNRLRGELGFCGVGRHAIIASAGPHFGEEPPLVGDHGSGTIFFSGCNLACVFCQNCDISQGKEGRPVAAPDLARIMLDLQWLGCHNINLVSPSHVVPQVLEALAIAAEGGLRLPLVYNSGGYDSLSTLRLLDGVVDIYMPDFKYWDDSTAARHSGAKGYPTVAREAMKEMHRQVGDLVLDKGGVAVRGLIVRHLVLPGDLAGTAEVTKFISKEVSPDTYINIMAQYYPTHKAFKQPPLNRRITRAEYERAVQAAKDAGLHRFAR